MTAPGNAVSVTSPAGNARWRGVPNLTFEETWALFFLTPFAVIFVFFIVYPVAYAIYLGTDLAVYPRVLTDPIYLLTVWNTFIFIIFGVGLKMLIALALSSYFVLPGRGIRIVATLFFIPWVVPHIPSILSIRWMLNSDWGVVDNTIFELFHRDGPQWLTQPSLGMLSIITVHIWKYLPFWTMILVAARLGISPDLYDAAKIDGATAPQRFRYVTLPAIAGVFVTSAMLSAIWSLGDFNSIYLLTGGGPMERTNTLATMGVRFALRQADFNAGVVTMMSALPVLVPLIVFLIRRMKI